MNRPKIAYGTKRKPPIAVWSAEQTKRQSKPCNLIVTFPNIENKKKASNMGFSITEWVKEEWGLKRGDVKYEVVEI
jgi:hypothetical protein